MLEQRVRTATRVLWALVAISQLLLALRILSVLIWGIGGGQTAPANAPGLIYSVTGPFVNPLVSAANFTVPYQGISHALDIAALMAMAILFFSALAVTKSALWCSRLTEHASEMSSSPR